MLIPIGNKILVAPAPKKTENKTESGIVLVQTQDTYPTGTVLAISEDLKEVRLKVSDQILYEGGSGVEVEGGLLMDYRSAVAILP